MPVGFRGVILSQPGVATYIDDSKASAVSVEAPNSVAIVGVADRGQPNVPLQFTDANSARAVYGSGSTSKPLVDGVIRALAGGASAVYGVRVGRAKPFSASITNGAGSLQATFVGTIGTTGAIVAPNSAAATTAGFSGSTGSTISASQTTYSVPVTVTAGDNRLLVLYFLGGASGAVSASNPPTFVKNGIATSMNLLGSANTTSPVSSVWYLTSPDVGTSNVNITMASTAANVGFAIEQWNNVNQVTPINTPVITQKPTSGASVNVLSSGAISGTNANNIIVSVVNAYEGTSVTAASAESQLQTWVTSAAASGNGYRRAYGFRRASVASGSSATMTYAANNGDGGGFTTAFQATWGVTSGAISSVTISAPNQGAGYLRGGNGTLYFTISTGGNSTALLSVGVVNGVCSGSTSVVTGGSGYSANSTATSDGIVPIATSLDLASQLTFEVNAYIPLNSGSTLTVSSLMSGTLGVGQVLSGGGGSGVGAGTRLLRKLNSDGTSWQVSGASQSVSSGVFTASNTELISLTTKEYGKFAKTWSINVAPSTNSISYTGNVNQFTGSITGTTLTITSVSAGFLYVGQTITGGGGSGILSGTTIVGFSTGNGGVGDYIVSASQNVSSGTITGSSYNYGTKITLTTHDRISYYVDNISSGSIQLFSNSATLTGKVSVGVSTSTVANVYTGSISGTTLTVSSMTSGSIFIGQVITGTNISSGTTVTDFISATGGVGTYSVSNYHTNVSATTITGSSQTFGYGVTLIPTNGVTDQPATTYLFSDYPRISNLIAAINNDGKFIASIVPGANDQDYSSTLDIIPASNFGKVPTYTASSPYVLTSNINAIVNGINNSTLGSFLTATLKSTESSITSGAASCIPSSSLSGLQQFQYVTSSGAVFNGFIAGQTLDVRSVSSGTIALNMPIFATGATSANTIIAYGSGTGGVGTYILASNQTIGDIGQPVVITGGATNGTSQDYDPDPVSSDWTNAFVALQNIECYFVVPMTERSSYHATALAHALAVSLPSGKKERMAIVGGALGETYTQAKARAAGLKDKRAVLVWPGIQDYDASGQLTLLPPYYLAAQIAGILAGQSDPAEPLTNRNIPVFGVETASSPAVLDDLVNNGVFTLRAEFNRGFVCVQSLTTWTGDLRIARREISTVRAADETMKLVRKAISGYVGAKSSMFLVQNIKDSATTALDAAVGKGLIFADPSNPILYPAYKDVAVRVYGDAYYVDFNISPAKPVNYLLITAYVS